MNFMIEGKNDWWNGRNKDIIDDYFFGHGLNYKKAMSDFIKIGGNIPMIPKYALGIWWTRLIRINF